MITTQIMRDISSNNTEKDALLILITKFRNVDWPLSLTACLFTLLNVPLSRQENDVF